MGSRNTQITATGRGKNATEGSLLAEQASILLGNAATLNNTTKAVDLAGAQVKDGGTVNVGEMGTSQTFANAIKDLFAGQQASTQTLISSLVPQAATGTNAAATSSTGSTPGSESKDTAPDATPGTLSPQLKKRIIAALIIGAVWWLLRKFL